MSMTGKHAYDADVIIIGGGIIGISTAMQLVGKYPRYSVLVLEKENKLGAHQTSHNSGVIHAGVYYTPGSLKADFCRRGAEATYAFCKRHDLPTERCGKLIVATSETEMGRLKDLRSRCESNALEPEFLDAKRLRDIEPSIVGIGAIRVASSGIADYPAITHKMAEISQSAGARIMLGTCVMEMREDQLGVTIATRDRHYRGRHAIVCGGLMADRLARMCGLDVDFRIVPFRGEYFRLPASRNGIVDHLIYPVPDPSLPFLGVHLTRMIGGYVTVGPNAVLALAREGYNWGKISLSDLQDMGRFGGFWRMLRQNMRAGFHEFSNSLWRRGYLQLCRRYCPELKLDDLEPYPAGVRAQAVMADGSLVHDFLIRRSGRSLHVCNAPSPAATSAIPIGQHLVREFEHILH